VATRTAPPPSASRRYAASALLARQAAKAAAKVRPQGLLPIARAIRTYQTTQAVLAERAVAEMLLEQGIGTRADALLDPLAFTTGADNLSRMLDSLDTDAEFNRLVESLIQDAGRAAESVSVAVRPDIYHVRFVSLPCCARCAVLAGRVYRWSEGFKRHPRCDCSMIPTTVASPLRQSPEDLFEDGQVRGLSKADQQALREGADMSRVINVRRTQAGLSESGRVLYRAGRMTPEAIYRKAGDDRAVAVDLLTKNGYVR
jgi:hypothetical protein